MKLYLIRHALPAIASYDNRPPGPGLGELGMRQAQWIQEFIAPLLPLQVYSSDFTRSLDTARTALGPKFKDCLNIDGRWRERQAEEESHASLLDRVSNWWEECHSKNNTDQIVVAHGGSINAMLEILDPTSRIFHYPYRDQWGIYTPIAGIWEIDISDHQAQLHPCPIK